MSGAAKRLHRTKPAHGTEWTDWDGPISSLNMMAIAMASIPTWCHHRPNGRTIRKLRNKADFTQPQRPSNLLARGFAPLLVEAVALRSPAAHRVRCAQRLRVKAKAPGVVRSPAPTAQRRPNSWKGGIRWLRSPKMRSQNAGLESWFFLHRW